MKTSLVLSFFILSITWTSAQNENNFTFKWDNGFKLTSADQNFKLKFGGRIMWDNAFFFQDSDMESVFGETKNGSEFRRARFFNSGQIYGKVKYKLQLDFAGGGVSFKDVFIELVDLPIGHLRMGHFKEPFRLEALTSSKYMTFMERGFPIDIFPERNTGIMIRNDHLDKRLSWQLGVFRRSNGAGNDVAADDGVNLTARVTGLPLMHDTEDKTQVLHLGAAISFRNPESETYDVESRPESHLAPKYIATGDIAGVENILVFGTEVAFVHNSFSAAGEFVQSSVNTMGSSDYNFSSFYVEISYFLTGESKVYKGSYSGFDRVKPAKNFGQGGAGAWELGLRFSSSDLNSGDINGGKLSDLTVGVNWYLNPASRMMFNYILASLNDVGNTSIAQMRVQVDF
ncbi:MAG: hypothetical protein HKN92_08320 [Chitinophagales bacterium]|nr:hypothetical protein [Chitinophagales bacterium]